jgi:putative Ca2+/H+ antiporter (TMEM165/GDT1 family)
MKAYVLVFLSVFVAEIGAKAQVAAVRFATDAALNRGAALGFVAIDARMLVHA